MQEKDNLSLVSVVVPCYNHEKYVTETIESIINQTYKNIELIVIDDGSKDNSVEVIQKLADKYGFTFIHRPNKGLSATLNEGIRLSKGKYFCACASDDKLGLEKIEKQVDFLEKNSNYAMCYANVIEFDNQGYEVKKKAEFFMSGFIFDDLILGNFIPAVSQLIKKDVFEKVGLYDESLYIEDWDMWLKISDKYEVGYMDEYLAYYRKHDANISSNILKMLDAQKKILNKWHNYPQIKQVYKHRELDWFNALALNHKKEALKLFCSIFPNIANPSVMKGVFKLFLTPSLFAYIQKIIR